MAHPRELIVQAVVALLIAASTDAGARVYNTRTDALKRSGLPAVAAYGLTDPINEEASSEMEVAYDLGLEVVAWADPDDINDLVNQVHAAMRADPYLGGLASDSELKGTVIGLISVDGRSDPDVAEAVLTFSFTYHIALEST